MWTYNSDFNKWEGIVDSLKVDDYSLLKEEIQSTRLYSKCLSGATYIPLKNQDNIYDILNNREDITWYIGIDYSDYTKTSIPTRSPQSANNDFYNKYNLEYGLSLKNLFTPEKLIKNAIKNYIEVDVATTTEIDDLNVAVDSRTIDGIKLKDGHRVLVKNQTTRVTLPSTTDPDTYFISNYEIVEDFGLTIEYEFFNNRNGIYIYNNGLLSKSNELDDYEKVVRNSVLVKLGSVNVNKQYHLERLLNGYFPNFSENQPVHFVEHKNWMLRNQVDYNNLFEINYFDVYKHGTQSYSIDNVTYTIPERIISIGEFGVIHNNQYGVSNIIENKYKVNLRELSETIRYYWIVGDSGTLLRVRKHDFETIRKNIDCACPSNNVITNLNSVSFYDNLNGVVVGELNTILITNDGGENWERIRFESFDTFNYNKVIYKSQTKIFIGADSGHFIELEKTNSGWVPFRRRISKFVDGIEEEYVLVDNINDMILTNLNVNLSFLSSSPSISSQVEVILLVTDDSNIIFYDINNSIPSSGTDFADFSFYYLEFPGHYEDIVNITLQSGTNNIFFTSMDGFYSIDFNNFNTIGIDNDDQNIITSTFSANLVDDFFTNSLFDYNGDEILIAGNTSLLKSSDYNSLDFQVLDPNFESRLKSKLLFLDYDVASKLNFFTDFGDYRLPNAVTFSSASFSTSSYLDFEPLTFNNTSGTQSEINWYEYWKDSNKTFEYLNPLAISDSSAVRDSNLFYYSSTQSQIVINSVTNNLSDIQNLAPNINDPENSRYDGTSTTITSPSSSFDLYLYEYLGVIRANVNDFQVEVGDVIRLDSQIVTSNFTINKIVNFGSLNYIYFFTEFNKNITNELVNNPITTITNLNAYSNYTELINRFNLHSISLGYELKKVDGYIELNAKFNNITSYYNLGTSVILNGDNYNMEYLDGFLNFGYTPTYNLLDYMESINDSSINPIFTANKEYLSMPIYEGIPMPGTNNFTDDDIYIDYTIGPGVSNKTTNKLTFGDNLEAEWESIFINTFVDINLYDDPLSATPSSTTEKLLVVDKYYDNNINRFIIEFDSPINYQVNNPLYSIDIVSRRKLHQISKDLQELNNIQRPSNSKVGPFGTFSVYDRKLNFKVNTDSYAKIMLSDSNTFNNITALLYHDNNNEFAMNICNVDEEVKVPIVNTTPFIPTGYTYSVLFIICTEEHGLKTDEGVVLEFNGGENSSEELNQQYFGYHPVNVINSTQFWVDIPYGTTPLSGNDSGILRYIKTDPFFNYSPVDLIDIGIDKRGKIAIELTPDNLDLSLNVFRLRNIDFNKFRFRLIDGLNIESLAIRFPWIYEAEISGAVIGLSENGELVWYKGTWECGRWFEGIWMSGTWISGDWYDGTWNSFFIKDNWISVEVDEKTENINNSTWFDGRWFDGTWNNGVWANGRYYGGTWNNGRWNKGIWNDGIWNDGQFIGGIWVLGTWNGGRFNSNNEPAYWLDGKWQGGDFENGMWYDGKFESKTNISRFGIKSTNSRTAIWQSGIWVNGSFYSGNEDNEVSKDHKLSIWKTGQWFGGDYWGGITYNIDFRGGTWNGGILEDIQVVGFFGSTSTSNNYFRLNGDFKFNTGDEISIIDNNFGGTYSQFGSNSSPMTYNVLKSDKIELPQGVFTDVYVDQQLVIGGNPVNSLTPFETNLKVVSRFRNANWKSGIWTNGIYDNGLWEGGIFYNGIFNANWM